MNSTAANNIEKHWKKLFGVELYKVDYTLKRYLYKLFGITLPKLADQRDYWVRRGNAYCKEITTSGYLEREVFFQDLIINELAYLDYDSAFEAGCGFGWNVGRIKSMHPEKRIGGLDFSSTQLENAKDWLGDLQVDLVNGDATKMPFHDNAFDVGFTLGVFMNIHPSKIRAALSELIRVSGKYILHVEYDETRTTPELREKRAFKTNIVSHDYPALYRELGKNVVKVLTHEDFGEAFRQHEAAQPKGVERWEGFEGPEKYCLVLVEV